MLLKIRYQRKREKEINEDLNESQRRSLSLTTALYALEHTYSSLHPTIQRDLILSNLPTISRLLVHRYTAVRHATSRLLTSITHVHAVDVMNDVLMEPLSELESSKPHHRQGITEFLHIVVKKLEIKIVPYIVLLVLPTLRRMSDPLADVRALSTLTFAQLVRLMPLDGMRCKVEGMSGKLAARKEEQKEFIEQLMDPSQIKDCVVPIKINATLRKYQQIRYQRKREKEINEDLNESQRRSLSLTTALYALEHTYSSLHPTIQRDLILSNLPTISRLLVHRYTAVRHATSRLLTSITHVHAVDVMNDVLMEPLSELESSKPHHRQGITEFLHIVVKKLEIKIVPYIVLLVLPTLRRMSDPLADVRALSTLTFAQLVRLMPLDGMRCKVEGMSGKLAARKEEQKVQKYIGVFRGVYRAVDGPQSDKGLCCSHQD
eukprot:sb/3464864/